MAWAATPSLFRPRPLLARLAAALGFAALAACGGAEPSSDRAAACGAPPDALGRFVEMPAGKVQLGARPVYPEEGPPVDVHVAAFRMQAHEVTNDQFAAFVAATGYETDAEKSTAAGGPAAGSAVFAPSVGQWRLAPGATWRTPDGPGGDLGGRGAYPVVHVSHADAAAYAAWAGGRLPSEVEWEYAAALGLADPSRPASGAYDAGGEPLANTWQGVFPIVDTGEDGFAGLAPAGCFAADRAGLYDMIGNVWEWTDTPFAPGRHTIKGGSYLCAENYCRRYRPAARQPQESDFSAGHIGFRIVKDASVD